MVTGETINFAECLQRVQGFSIPEGSQSVFDHIIDERGLDRTKVLIRVGPDGGQGSFKVIVSIFETDYDPDITFSEKEGPGNRLFGCLLWLCVTISR